MPTRGIFHMTSTTSVTASAPAKAILFGEHAVVYGHPAVAVPLHELKAHVTVTRSPHTPSQQITIAPPKHPRTSMSSDSDTTDILIDMVKATLHHFHMESSPDIHVTIDSAIPISSGLGSSSATLIAVVRALANYFGEVIKPAELIPLVNSIDSKVHGGASGLDATVIAYAQCLAFSMQKQPELLPVPKGFQFLIADSGMHSYTKTAVAQVRNSRMNDPQLYDDLFETIGSIANSARSAISLGRPDELGPLMDRNNELLRRIGVSNNQLNRLTKAARLNGALGAKISGAGLGGHTISLVDDAVRDRVREALLMAGATRVIDSRVQATL